MYTRGQKESDSFLVPSGEKRLSNFMLWQSLIRTGGDGCALAGLYRADLDAAIEEFQRRSRRSAAFDPQYKEVLV